MSLSQVYAMHTNGKQAEEIRYWWSQAESSLAAADREIQAGELLFAMNRVYFAAYYGVCAALLDRHVAFQREATIRMAFFHKFIRTGVLDPDWARFYDQIAEDRQTADYAALASFERAYVLDMLGNCRRFLAELGHVIPTLSKSR
jgi:hypothetical protein